MNKSLHPALAKPNTGPKRGIGSFMPRKQVTKPVKPKKHLTWADLRPTGLGDYGDVPDPGQPEPKQENPFKGTPHTLAEPPGQHRLNCRGRARKAPARVRQPVQPSQPTPLPKMTPIPNPTFQYKFDNEMTKDEERCLALLNRYRKQENLPPLEYSRKLAEIIAPHNHECALKQVCVGHDGFRERAKKIPRMKKAGENIGMCKTRFDYIDILMQRWMESPHHRKNIMGDYNKVGMAFEMNDKGEWFGSHLFAKV